MRFEKTTRLLIHIVLIIAAIITLFPLVYVIMASFKTNAEILTNPSAIFPAHPTFNNYIEAWNSDVFDVKRMFFNSMYYTIAVVASTLLTSSMGGYVFAIGEFRGKKFWLFAFSITMFFSMGSVTIYPMLKILNVLHVPKSLPGLMLIRIFSVSIVNIYLVRSYIYSLPKDLIEASKIDGCGFYGTFFRIIFPLLKPIMATIGILGFQGSWNEYLMPMIFTLGNPKQSPLIVGVIALSKSGEAAASYNLVFAGTVISLLPVLVAYCVANKYFVSGLTAGAVKG
ncbi:MAG: carbohydrate ABC transporter permease [Sharpea porci]|uniref:carbohydrate ABC transporter permease n=1 Tax=Sharpea porci TaxID=2652286 RepID=UPI00240A80B2|nr:carbohydrate ABC transporter permease [Sharpea porci]MDD6710531.1 carbohydrate ABC transporter permease [Sharpea porci]